MEENEVILLHVDDAERVVSVVSGEAQNDRLGRVLKQGVPEVLRFEHCDRRVLIVRDGNGKRVGARAFAELGL